MDVWVEQEIEGCEFPDERLKKRFWKAARPTGKQDRRRTTDGMPGLGGDKGSLSVL